MLNRPFNFLAAFAILFIILRMLIFVDPLFAQVKYTLPALALCLILLLVGAGVKHLKIMKVHLVYYGTFLGLYAIIIANSIGVSFFGGSMSSRHFTEAFLIMAPLSLCLLLSPFYTRQHHEQTVKVLFWGTLAYYCLGILISGTASMFLHPMELLRNLVLPSDLETGTVFTFGLLTIYFIARKNTSYAIFGFLLTVLSFKRVGLAAIFVTVLAMAILSPLFKRHRSHNVLVAVLVAGNLLTLYLVLQFAIGKFDNFIRDTFQISANLLTLGRQATFSQIYSSFGYPTWFGLGLGNLYDFVAAQFSVIESVHSDLIKNLYEFGILGFLLWIGTFYKMNSRILGMLALTIFMNVLFLTDNVFVYFRVMFVFYFLQMSLMIPKDAE